MRRSHPVRHLTVLRKVRRRSSCCRARPGFPLPGMTTVRTPRLARASSTVASPYPRSRCAVRDRLGLSPVGLREPIVLRQRGFRPAHRDRERCRRRCRRSALCNRTRPVSPAGPSRSAARPTSRFPLCRRAGHPPCRSPTGTRGAPARAMTIDTERLRELAAELGSWPATTDEADIERHQQHNKNADYWLARAHRFDHLRREHERRRQKPLSQ